MEIKSSFQLFKESLLPFYHEEKENEEEISLLKLLYLYSNPFKSISCLCEKPSNKHKKEREILSKQIFVLIGSLRFLNLFLWILLIFLYYKQINKQFHKVFCLNNSISYCSNYFLLNSYCERIDEMCEISNSFLTLSILIFLSLSQIMVFFIKDRAANGTTVQSDPSHDGVESPISLTFSYLGPLTSFYLFLLFALEAIVLPFGTKQLEIAFVQFKTHNLEYTILIFLSILAWGILLTFYQSIIEIEDGCGWRVVTILFFAIPYILSLLVIIVHIAVVIIWNIIDSHQFYTSNLFFFSLHGEFLLYKSIRTFFSIFSLLEAVLTWICIRLDQGERVWWEWSEGHGEFERERISISRSDCTCLLCCSIWLDWPTLIPTPDADQIE